MIPLVYFDTMTNENNQATVEGDVTAPRITRPTQLTAKQRADNMRHIKAEVSWRGNPDTNRGDRISIEWDDQDNNHYHIWLTTDRRMDDMTGEHVFLGGRWFVAKNTIYVNPPQDIDPNDPRHFRTKTLDAAAKVNAWMLYNAWNLTDIDDAYAAYDRKEEQAAIKREHARRAVRLEVSSARGDHTLDIDIRDVVLEENWDSTANLELLKKIYHAAAVAVGLNAGK